MPTIAILALLTFFVSVFAHPTDAQQPGKIYRIGILSPTSASTQAVRLEAFRRRLRQLGYVEGKNIVIEYRYSEGKRERFPDLAAELVGLKVDVIVTASGPAILAAKKASPTMPIVFAAAADPVGDGYVGVTIPQKVLARADRVIR